MYSRYSHYQSRPGSASSYAQAQAAQVHSPLPQGPIFPAEPASASPSQPHPFITPAQPLSRAAPPAPAPAPTTARYQQRPQKLPPPPSYSHVHTYARAQKPMARLMTYSGLLPAFDEAAAATAVAAAAAAHAPQRPGYAHGPASPDLPVPGPAHETSGNWRNKYMRLRGQQKGGHATAASQAHAEASTGLGHTRGCSTCTAPKLAP
jgi:hypothetical protein